MNEPSLSTILETVFGDANWHRVVRRPGVWAYSRAEGFWQEMIKQEEIVTTAFDVNTQHPQHRGSTDTEVNVAVGEKETRVELATLADKVRYYDQLTEAINQAQADRLKVQEEIKAAMGEATTATLGGVPTFTYQNKEAWRTADIKREMPELVEQYIVTQEVRTVDWARFFAHHREAMKPYQTREFRRVSGTRATRG